MIAGCKSLSFIPLQQFGDIGTIENFEPRNICSKLENRKTLGSHTSNLVQIVTKTQVEYKGRIQF
jgi:hypothetical protein